MVPKTKGALRHMHLISEMHLTEELRDCVGRGLEAQDPNNGASILAKCMIGATGELDCFSALIHLREPGKSKDKA
ncbi:hypothetical protein BHM03_00054688, partial [Ensete ventricosum]